MHGTKVNHNGIDYPSISHLARAHGRTPRSIHNRLACGDTIEQALARKPGESLRIKNERSYRLGRLKIKVEGDTNKAVQDQWCKIVSGLYKVHSSSEIARMCGCTSVTIRRELIRCGVKIKPKGGSNHNSPLVYKGKHYKSVSAAARSEGVSPDKVHGFMWRNGCGIVEAIKLAKGMV